MINSAPSTKSIASTKVDLPGNLSTESKAQTKKKTTKSGGVKKARARISEREREPGESQIPKQHAVFDAAVAEDDLYTDIHTLHAAWLEDAKQHMMEMSPLNDKKERWSVFSTSPFQLADYGEGIQLYFMFLDMFTILFAVTAILALPALIWNTSGNWLEANGHEGPSSTANNLARTTVANLGTLVQTTIDNVTTNSREVIVNGQKYEVRDITYAMGLLDAISVLIIFVAAVWLQYVIIPAVKTFQHGFVVTPDDFTVLVKNLPRQIEDQENYEASLKKHFEALLKGQLQWDNAYVGMSVVSKDDKGAKDLPVLRYCNWKYCPKRSNGRDKRGRRLGTIEARSIKKGLVWVVWKYMPALFKDGTGEQVAEKKDSEVKKFEVSDDGTSGDLRDAALLNHLEDCECLADGCSSETARGEEEHPVIYSVALVRDFEGKLSSVRKRIQEFFEPEKMRKSRKARISARISQRNSKSSARKSEKVSFAQLKSEMTEKSQEVRNIGQPDKSADKANQADLGTLESAAVGSHSAALYMSELDKTPTSAAAASRSAALYLSQLESETPKKDDPVFAWAHDEMTEKPLKERDVIAAYITFSHAKHRNFISGSYRFSRSLLMQRASPQRLEWNKCKLEVRDAVPPSDVYWEDMDYPYWKRVLRRMVLFLVCLLFIGFSVGFFAAASKATSWAREYTSADCEIGSNETQCQCVEAGISNVLDDRPAGIYDLCQDWLQRRFTASLVSSLASVSVLVVNLATSASVHRLGEFPKPKSVTEACETVIIILALAQILNMGLVTLLVNADLQISILGDGILDLVGAGDFTDLVPAWYSNVGGAILLTMCINAIFPLTGAVQVLQFYFQRRRAKEGMTRLELFALFTPPEFLFAVQHATILAVTTSCMIFSACMPLLWLLLFITVLGQKYTDRYTFFCGSCVPPSYSDHIMKVVALWLQSVCWWHCAFAVWSFGTPESVPSYCPRCEGNNQFLLLWDAEFWVDGTIGNIERAIFDSNYVSSFLDHAMMSSSRPNLVVFFIICCFNSGRFLVWCFGKGVFFIKSSVELIDDGNDDLEDIAEVVEKSKTVKPHEDVESTKVTETAKQAGEVVGKSSPRAGEVVAKSSTTGAKKLVEKSFTKRLSKELSYVKEFSLANEVSKWQDRPPGWRKFLHPAGAVCHGTLFDYPFGGKPKESMEDRGILISYDMEHVAREIWGKHAHSNAAPTTPSSIALSASIRRSPASSVPPATPSSRGLLSIPPTTTPASKCFPASHTGKESTPFVSARE